jgi:hypothetical protein
MNWHARPQACGSLVREIPQSVQSPRGAAGACGGAQYGASISLFPEACPYNYGTDDALAVALSCHEKGRLHGAAALITKRAL